MNIPAGTQNDSAAPWNEPRVKKVFREHYVLAEAATNVDKWYRVHFIDGLEAYDLRKMSERWCVTWGMEYIDDTAICPKMEDVYESNDFYE